MACNQCFVNFRLQKNLFLDVFDRVQICHIADDKAYPGNDQLISRTWKDELIACGEKSNLTGRSRLMIIVIILSH